MEVSFSESFALAEVQRTQSEFWSALRDLEHIMEQRTGAICELESSTDYNDLRFEDLLRASNDREQHPQTDEHLAGCASCMMAHDKALPDEPALHAATDVLTVACGQLAELSLLLRAQGLKLSRELVRDRRRLHDLHGLRSVR